MAATPDREVKRKWSISASTDYLNKTSKDNYMARNNPIGNFFTDDFVFIPVMNIQALLSLL